MINKLIIDKENVELTGSSTPYYHTFAQAKTHEVKFGLDNTTEVCAYAFSGCSNLTKVELPEKITMIKRGAFKNCSSLPSITVGKNIEYIGKEAFDGCTNLNEIIFENENPKAISIFCNIPSRTTCFVPNNSKYVEITSFDDIDMSGDEQYFTRTPWYEYKEVLDVTEIKSEDFIEGPNRIHYYKNQWSNVGTGSKLREIKDKVVITGINIKGADGLNKITSTSAEESSTFNITYEIMPSNATYTHLYWFSKNGRASVEGDTGTPGVAKVTTYALSGNTTAIDTITAYSESGQTASFTLYVTKRQ